MRSSARHAFAGYSAAVLYRQPSKKSPVQQLLWGDWLRILEKRRDGWWFVHSRGCDGWIQSKLVQRDRLFEKTGRSIAIYGAINLRTDGKRAILAQERERPRAKGQKWDIYKLEPDEQGELRYAPRY